MGRNRIKRLEQEEESPQFEEIYRTARSCLRRARDDTVPVLNRQ